MKDEITKEEYLAFVKEHEKDADLQFNLTDCEIEVLLHALGYKNLYDHVAYAEWRNGFDNGNNARKNYTQACKHLCELSIMDERIVEIFDNNHVYFATELGKKVARIKYVQLVKEKKTKGV